MAEFIMKSLVRERGCEEGFYIESAAVSEEEIGNTIYPPAKRCLAGHGIWFDPEKRARRMTRSDYDRFDMIIYMDRSNLNWLRHIIDGDAEGKLSMMMSYTGQQRDVADPWYTGDFERTFNDIHAGCSALLDFLVKY